jgi:photosystem II stability/assembly factor-like uncharacterized protein
MMPTTGIVRRTSLRIVVCAGLLGGCSLLAAGCGSGAGPAGVVPRSLANGLPVVRDEVAASGLLDKSSGWVLTPRALSRTDDGGRTWVRITPAGVRVGQIANVFFLNAHEGWLARSSPGDRDHVVFQLFLTRDGGSHWRRLDPRLLALAPDGYGSSPGYGWVDIDFLDPKHGHIALAVQGNTSVSAGDLYRTSDGGRSWSKVGALPKFGEIRFFDPTTGWLAGGQIHDQLFVTRDAGRTWQRVHYPEHGVVSGRLWDETWLDAPVFFDPKHGVLSVSLVTVDAKGLNDRDWLVFETTSDGGRSWQVAARLAQAECCVGSPVSLLGFDRWLAVTGNGRSVVQFSDTGKQAKTISTTALPLYGRLAGVVTSADFADDKHGWIQLGTGYCLSFKTDCHNYENLYATADGGRHWRQLLPPNGGPELSVHPS